MKKKKKIIIGVVVVFFVIGIIGSFFGSDDTDTAPESTSAPESSVAPESTAKHDTEESESQLSTTATKTPDETEKSDDLNPDFPDSVDGVDISFAKTVNGDTTGNWRLARVSSTTPTIDYALDYYKHFFSNNDEIHTIVNYTLNTSTAVRYLCGYLYVTTHEYVDGEERSASSLYSGAVLDERMINLKTGKAEILNDTEE